MLGADDAKHRAEVSAIAMRETERDERREGRRNLQAENGLKIEGNFEGEILRKGERGKGKGWPVDAPQA